MRIVLKVLTKVLKEKVIEKKATKITKLKNELIYTIIESDSEEEVVVKAPRRPAYKEAKPIRGV
jgi:hypothetical protein